MLLALIDKPIKTNIAHFIANSRPQKLVLKVAFVYGMIGVDVVDEKKLLDDFESLIIPHVLKVDNDKY